MILKLKFVVMSQLKKISFHQGFAQYLEAEFSDSQLVLCRLVIFIGHRCFLLLLLTDDQRQKLAVDTLDELEWCLEQLEPIQTHKSVSDMATSKVSSDAQQIFCSSLEI